jgi:hypothetical protein
MSAKSAAEKKFHFVPVPKRMRPTAESLEKMGNRISYHIKRNNAMRSRSAVETSNRVVG